MMRARLAALLTLVLAIVARADGPASDSQSPQSVFDSRGLTVSDSWLVLRDETGVHTGVGQVKQDAQTVHVETTSRRDLRFEIQGDRHNLESLLDDLVVADTQINRLIAARQRMGKDDPNYANLIDMYNAALTHRDTVSGQVSGQQESQEDAARRLGQVTDSRAAYDNAVMNAATNAESVAKAYAALSQDPVLTQAIAAANVNAGPPLKLGPSPDFTADLEFLRKAVKDVVDSPIPVRRDSDSNELYVQAVLNGNAPDEMMWDSGADLVMLSADTARGLQIKFADQDMEMGMADGKTERVRVGILDSVRVGGFTVKNVQCFVLPDSSNGHADDLIGDSFQTHFVSRMDQRAQELQLTPIDSSVVVGVDPQNPAGAK